MKFASVVLLIVDIAELFVVILVALVAMSVSLELMLDAFVVMLAALVAMSVTLELMLVELVLMLDSTSVKSPNAKVPSISASLRMVTVPEVWPNDKSPVEKSPKIRLFSVEEPPAGSLTQTENLYEGLDPTHDDPEPNPINTL